MADFGFHVKADANSPGVIPMLCQFSKKSVEFDKNRATGFTLFMKYHSFKRFVFALATFAQKVTFTSNLGENHTAKQHSINLGVFVCLRIVLLF